MRVIEGALTNIPILVDERPARAGVVALEEAALVILDERVDTIRVRAGHGNADASDEAVLRQSFRAGDLGPVLAAVDALEETASGAAGGHRVFLAIRFPHRRVHDIRIVAVDRQIDRRCAFIAKEHLAE